MAWFAHLSSFFVLFAILDVIPRSNRSAYSQLNPRGILKSARRYSDYLIEFGPWIIGAARSNTVENVLRYSKRANYCETSFVYLIAFNYQKNKRRSILRRLQKDVKLLNGWPIVGMFVICSERIAKGASTCNELRIGREPPIFAPCISFVCSILLPLHPCGFYLLATHDETDRSAKNGSDQGRCRSQPKVDGHTATIRDR